MTLGPDPIPLHVGNSSMRAIAPDDGCSGNSSQQAVPSTEGGVFRRHTMYHVQGQISIDHMTLKDYNFLFIYKPG